MCRCHISDYKIFAYMDHNHYFFYLLVRDFNSFLSPLVCFVYSKQYIIYIYLYILPVIGLESTTELY